MFHSAERGCSRSQQRLLLRAALRGSREPGTLVSPGKQSLGFTGSPKMSLPMKNNTDLSKHLKERCGRTNTAQAPCEAENCCADAKLHCHQALTSKHLSYGGNLRSYLMLLHPNVQCCLGILICWLCAALYYVDITLVFPELDVLSALFSLFRVASDLICFPNICLRS